MKKRLGFNLLEMQIFWIFLNGFHKKSVLWVCDWWWFSFLNGINLIWEAFRVLKMLQTTCTFVRHLPNEKKSICRSWSHSRRSWSHSPRVYGKSTFHQLIKITSASDDHQPVSSINRRSTTYEIRCWCDPLLQKLKNLGLLINQDLTWDDQVNKICRNVSYTLIRLWPMAVLCVVYKKADKLDCKNYRGICPLNNNNNNEPFF
jgi:hypothetical protein